ncbi:pantoate--beta-alanine ligase [Syntrophothermus lipocalidus]|uniref:Pantothenate synthetase n=1 Tax=Syntrophothermus lipocalidus (strain DSM 12680 / TGB-C1) TaxID=643648 RepID=D7CJ48_SYNLT|nr:pantoate--beta-alanine ligase [Syntrophothermus lipocalidus]ADI00937.1 pantoate/beta-alanine ligase [Syntrophothermus lipocalidus DSM 12680]
MQVFTRVQEMQEWSLQQKRLGKKIGLVPTMGYLHDGHLSLVRRAKAECDVVIVSIFVNPLQFGVGEDYEEYPRDLTRDAALLEKEGVEATFAPSVKEMYPQGYSTTVEVGGEITAKLCGKSRPGHFKGVTTVVSKLFNICLPEVAYFGQKDAQQAMIIEKMVRELNFPLRIVRGPIVRESDGLAMSSRNVYLNEEERKSALVLSQALGLARELIENGETSVGKVKEAMINLINSKPFTDIDYVEIYNGEDLSDLAEIKGKVLVALAVRVGKTRLIDNLLLEV